MVKLLSTLPRIVLLLLVTHEVETKFSYRLNITKTTFKDNSKINNICFSMQLMRDTLRTLFKWTNGTTAEEIKNIMTFESNPKERTMPANSRLFMSKDVLISGHIDVERIDFKNTEKAVNTMNAWVANYTKGNITKLITKVNKDTKIMLLSATQMRIIWKTGFNKNNTIKAPFFITAKKTIQVNMMSQVGKFRHKYFKSIDTDILELPMKKDDVSMLILLPRQKDGLKLLVDNLTTLDYYDLFKEGKPKLFKVELPQFRITFTTDFKKTLMKVGIKQLFSQAHFINTTDIHGKLQINEMLQKTVFQVNENGVEAAAGSSLYSKLNYS